MIIREAPAPSYAIMAGDWHGYRKPALRAVDQAAAALRHAPKPWMILHVGDLGITATTGGQWFLTQLSAALQAHDMTLWFVDGNHDNHAKLSRIGARVPAGRGVPLADRIWHIRRGERWDWHGRTWLALGGAVSVDRIDLLEGVNWWPEEEITPELAEAVTAAGRADVLISHDCPAGVVHSFPRRADWWAHADLERARKHAELLQRVVVGVRAGHIFHGHLHRGYSRRCDFGYGDVQVTGLDREGEEYNLALVDVHTMRVQAVRPLPAPSAAGRR